MSLLLQIQVAVVSIFFGALFLLIFGFINRLFYHITILKNIIIILYFIVMSIIYFYIILYFTDGVLKIYYPMFLLIGGYIYQKIYAKYFLRLYEVICLKFKLIIINPIRLKFKKIKSILEIRKKKRKKNNGKRKAKKTQPIN